MNANHFTEVLLPMHIKLQGLYRERCGDWQQWDKYYCTIDGQIRMIYPDEEGMRLMPCCCHVVWLPRTIDDSSPEASKRSLWGMVDWELFTQEMADGEGNINIYENPYIHLDGQDAPIGSGTPTEAILRALCHQEGIEI